MSVHPTDYLVHFSNTLLLVSYSVRNILWLRWFAVAAALTNMPYFPVLEAAGVRAHLVAVWGDPGHRLQIEKQRFEPIEDATPHIQEPDPARSPQILPPGRG